MKMDGAEKLFFVDSKPIEVCRVARGKRCRMDGLVIFQRLLTLDIALPRTLIILAISCTLSVG